MSPRFIVGHGLIGQGWAHSATGRRLPSKGFYSPAVGRAKCRCGALSEVLPSTAARKRWHKDVHKPEVAREYVPTQREAGDDG